MSQSNNVTGSGCDDCSNVGEAQAPEYTGKLIVVFDDATVESPETIKTHLRKACGISSCSIASQDNLSAFDVETLEDGGATYFPNLGIAVVMPSGDQASDLQAAADDENSVVLSVGQDQIMYASSMSYLSEGGLEYARGYRDAVNHFFDAMAGKPGVEALEEIAGFVDNGRFTWGLQATKAHTSRFTGAGIKVAVLDTGMDLKHPDFKDNRIVATKSFISGQLVQDGNGHGTHCIGTACGPKQPKGTSRRYGCATAAQILAGKVLSNSGSGATSGIIAGIDWAIGQGANIISMSLGNGGPCPIQKIPEYQTASRRALQKNVLVVCAAGNNAQRPANIGCVSAPANSEDALAVAAIDSNLAIARFSAASSSVTGANVDIAGPGVAVFSSWPTSVSPLRYHSISGTSMATPHVAGIAALWAQASGLRGRALWNKLTQTTLRLNLPTRDVGTGLVQAPQ